MAKHKVLYALLAVAVVAGSGILTRAVWADGENCAASNLGELETCLAGEATSITTTGTIVVSGEVDRTLVIDRTIDGAAGYDVFSVENGAKLTLRGTGTINAGRYGARVDGAELLIDGVKIDATQPSSYGVYALNNGRVTMGSGMVVADYAAFAGNNTTGDMNFYIEGGILRSNRYPAIYMPGQVDLQMRGGTLDGGIVARMGQIVIEAGTINKQATPVAGDGIDQNYSSMPSVANEAITLLAGTYKSANAEHGNDMNVTIADGNVQINGDIVLYDFGNTADGYAQNVNVTIAGGRLTGFKTKFTTEEIGFDLRAGYTAGLNNASGRINIDITGGDYTVKPAVEDLAPGYEAELDEDTGVYVVWPKQADFGPEGAGYIESDGSVDGQLWATVDIGKELLADRKATLSATEVDVNELTLTGEGELIGAVDLAILGRGGQVIEVSNNELVVSFDIDEETYAMLSQYDKLYAVYFNKEGEEVERHEITLENGDNTWYRFWFETTHLSTYGVVGVNETAEPAAAAEETAATPETGTMTVTGASASVAAIVTAVLVGLLVSATSLAYLIRKR
ncbi:hypothetical protein IKF73_00350 [Candidatus Saccharibacteria bacterium]|nr:hypothetical protein [Candidatus Saccharibacteria bacterium]